MHAAQCCNLDRVRRTPYSRTQCGNHDHTVHEPQQEQEQRGQSRENEEQCGSGSQGSARNTRNTNFVLAASSCCYPFLRSPHLLARACTTNFEQSAAVIDQREQKSSQIPKGWEAGAFVFDGMKTKLSSRDPSHWDGSTFVCPEYCF